MGKPTLREELREIGEALAESHFCVLEGEEDDMGRESTHENLHECWNCWGRYLVARSRRKPANGGRG